MESYSVKQIADMLNTQPETVRRWIRKGKLIAEKTSRKDGNVISEENLLDFLKGSPKYAGVMGGIIGAAATVPLFAIPAVGGIAATCIAASKKAKEIGDDSFSKEELIRFLQEEVTRRNQSIEQKMKTIEQIQREIMNDQQQIAECNYALEQLED